MLHCGGARCRRRSSSANPVFGFRIARLEHISILGWPVYYRTDIHGANRSTTYVSPTQLTFTLLDSDVASARTLTITVLNPNNKISPSVSYTITQPSTVPTITLLSPDHVTAGSGAFTLSVVGTNFVNGSTVKANSASRVTTFVDSQHLTVKMLASDVQTAGSLSIVVNNPNGQVSTPATFTITSATLPTITSLSPS